VSQPSIKVVAERIQQLKQSGNATELSNLLHTLNQSLGLSAETFAPVIAEAEANAQRAFNQLPKEIKDAAEVERIEFSAHPPFFRLGCFKLKRKEKKRNQWDLSALDNVIVQTVQAESGREIVVHVLNRIKEIEAVVVRASTYAKELRGGYELLQEAVGSSERVSPNLLMIVMSAKSLRRALTLGDVELAQPLSRVAFGYLLATIQKSNETQLEFKPATQLETAKQHAFLSVPIGSLNPRELCESRPVANIKVGL